MNEAIAGGLVVRRGDPKRDRINNNNFNESEMIRVKK